MHILLIIEGREEMQREKLNAGGRARRLPKRACVRARVCVRETTEMSGGRAGVGERKVCPRAVCESVVES
jgi:hypothetical protein